MADDQPTQDTQSQQDQSGQQDVQQSTDGARYTDDDVDKLKGGARKAGRQAGINSVLTELGVDSLDDLKNGWQSYRDFQNSQKSELDSLKESYSGVETERDEAYAELARIRMDGALKDAFLDAGIAKQSIPAALRVSDYEKLDFDEDQHVTGIEDVIRELRESVPQLFGRERQSAPDATRNGDSAETFTREQIEAMSPEEINTNWDKVQRSLSRMN